MLRLSLLATHGLVPCWTRSMQPYPAPLRLIRVRAVTEQPAFPCLVGPALLSTEQLIVVRTTPGVAMNSLVICISLKLRRLLNLMHYYISSLGNIILETRAGFHAHHSFPFVMASLVS